MTDEYEPYEYVLYVDEAGDDGLKRVKPIDKNGGSEWLCIGGLLIRAKFEHQTVEWVKDMRADINAVQGPALHYRDLSPTKRARACELLARYPCRLFAVASNKKNMRGYNNSRAAKRGGKQWYYNYCVRLLMERVTDFCLLDSIERFGSPRYVRVVFSLRGGHSYGQTKAYWQLLKAQAAGGSTFLNKREIAHQVLRFGLVEYVPHYSVAGLQLADVVASSIYQAADALGPKWAVEPAKALEPRMGREANVVADYGLVLQPSPPWKANLTDDQKSIFSHYGYKF
ncbi:DUF3800 domain-containing protein [Tropicimonas isoalkanivorans]|uniref:DUF3800 domain-containing protein n=1 Tax=Tropicimonas isoalkanivorans TaxID=441112 RepID=A0A1I1QHR2_9RHOB|nr:DUF3800 domain-containing protein [Tropicimonas isoalkanivorans]SFD19348.1 Protein of unknown function [Tropicimonas isoalkanivorans]